MTPLPPMLTCEDVMQRYRLRDARAARHIIREAGGKVIGGRWQVRLERIIEWEDTDKMVDNKQTPINDRSRPGHVRRSRQLPGPLADDWHTPTRATT